MFGTEEFEISMMRPQAKMFKAGEGKTLKIALVGNPNSGKSTLFNLLTGLNQKIANFPGVTVESHTGFCFIPSEDGNGRIELRVTDLPGTYSLYPKSPDERIPFQVLCDPGNSEHPDLTIVIADASNLKRSLFLCSQIIDLGNPVILTLNMMDQAEDKGIEIDIDALSRALGIRIVGINARKNIGISNLKKALAGEIPIPEHNLIATREFAPEVVDGIRDIVKVNREYVAFQIASNLDLINYFNLRAPKKEAILQLIRRHHFSPSRQQAAETLKRYEVITEILSKCISRKDLNGARDLTSRLDNVLTHRVWGYFIFLGILFLMFQAIFAWSVIPMDFVESSFSILSSYLNQNLPEGLLSDLLVNGIVAGLSGIVIFIPQIALLFLFIAILEDTGYMARVSFLMDKMMRRFGLNGKSVIPLVSGVACAVPAIMATRTIQNWRDRIITIMVTPLMSCSARLPVYTLIIAMVVPSTYYLGVINLQGLVLMGLYLIGFFAAIGTAFVMKYLIKARDRGFFIMELPVYRMPRWSNVGLTILDKIKVFLFEAGKVIIAISVILWVLSSFGPPGVFDAIEKKFANTAYTADIPADEIETKIASEKLESSFAGIFGHAIEPAIKPLGFDWKIGIALITSFAAREVFVGTMATIYSVGSDDSDTQSIREKMMAERNPDTGEKVYTRATGFSLMIFYAFAMQCMSTIAVVKRETGGWKWPLIQIFYLSALAYLSSLLIYQLFK